MCLQFLNEIKCKYLSLKHDQPFLFTISEWQLKKEPNVIYFVYRWTIYFYFQITLIVTVLPEKDNCGGKNSQNGSFDFRWFIYLTHWGYIVYTIQFLIAALLVTNYFIIGEKPNCLSKMYPFYWLVNGIAINFGYTICLLYWSVVYEGKPGEVTVMNLLEHAFHVIFLLIDTLIVAHPVRLLHLIYSLIFGIVYLLFTLIYYYSGGTNGEGENYIYKSMSWARPGIALLYFFCAVLALCLLHLLNWFIYQLRQSCAEKCRLQRDWILDDREQ